jgi:hypothetical protein
VKALLAAALVGIVHVHHAPSHDTDAPFSDLLQAAEEIGLDFVVLTEHSDRVDDGPLAGASRAGLHRAGQGHRLLVLVGAEFGTADGHLIGLDIPRAYASQDASGEPVAGRELIDRIHADGGFAVVPHPFTHGGWEDWEAPFDGLEVQNNASDYRRQYGPLYPFRLLRFAFDPRGGLASMLERPARELDRWESMLQGGRRVVAFAGADAHQNTSILGWRLDPYTRMFRQVQMLCPEGPLEPAHVWSALRSGSCAIRWRVHERRNGADGAHEVRFPSGRTELWLGDGRRVLEVRSLPPDAPPAAPPRSPDGPRSP